MKKKSSAQQNLMSAQQNLMSAQRNPIVHLNEWFNLLKTNNK